MAEVLVGVGAAASLLQLLSYTLKTSKAVTEFAQDFHEAPSELFRIQDSLRLLNELLGSLSSHLDGVNDDELLPPDLRHMVETATEKVERAIAHLKTKCDTAPHGGLRKRCRFAAVDRYSITKMCARLEEAHITLFHLIHIITLCNSLRTAALARENAHTINAIHTLLNEKPGLGSPTRENRIGDSGSIRNYPLKASPCSYVLVDSWLRTIGFYGSVTFTSTTDNLNRTRIVLGYKLPMLNRTVTLLLQLAYGTSWNYISILPGYIHIQNRVPIDSRFMSACGRGDVEEIRQCLDDMGMGIISNKTTCSGKTPLLLAIESKNEEAVRCLLEAKADPNMADDFQILPIFSALGYFARKKSGFFQFPPPTNQWLSMIRLLIQHGASVHESIRGQTLTSLNLYSPDYETNTILNFFRLLSTAGYHDFSYSNNESWSAVDNAFRDPKSAIPTIDFLANIGVPLARAYCHGRTAIHIAAGKCDFYVLEHLYTVHSMTAINRPDSYGCTPLHHAVFNLWTQKHEENALRFLLEKGADVNQRGRLHRFMMAPGADSSDEYTPAEYAAALGPEVLKCYRDALVATGRLKNEENETDDVFYDSHEFMTGN